MIKLSIIIPAYNAEPWIHELLERLKPQITNEVEVIIIDDGSKVPLKIDHEWVQLIRQKNSGISKARNKGLKMAKGEIIAFIDADDLVSHNYVEYILSRISEKWDYMDLSWKSLEDSRFLYKLSSDKDRLDNPSACTRVFRRSFIGDTRFPEKKDACEDEHFTRHLGIKNAKRVCATEYMYYYRVTVPNSNSKKYLENRRNTKRIAYYFDHVTADMKYLIDEFKKEDETNEVFLLTNRNDIPELEKYSQIWCPPRNIRAMEKRGEPTDLIDVIPQIMKTQVIIYTNSIDQIGGVETFCYSFCKVMSQYYDIICLYDDIAPEQLKKLLKVVRCVRNNVRVPIACDTIIVNRLLGGIPSNVIYEKSVQMVHCLKQQPSWIIPQDRDVIVNVSQASKDSFGEEAKDAQVIHNLTVSEKVDDALFLISAIRVGADDKQGNDQRCRKFAEMLTASGIPFIWIYFGDRAMNNEPPGMMYGGLTNKIKSFIKLADYLVLLSGSEAFNYSLLEALELNVPVVVTPLDQNKDMQIEDGVNGYIVPFEVEGFDVRKLLKRPQFEYTHDNKAIIAQWRKILGNKKPTKIYKPNDKVMVRVTRNYYDMVLERDVKCDETFLMDIDRALFIESRGYVECI